MNSISVVIIAKNEAHIIAKALQAVTTISNDVLVVDSGSTDGTQAIARSLNASVIETSWEGFGWTKNKGIAAAKHDWILSIDADEVPDENLLKALQQADLSNPNRAYQLNRKSFLGAKMIRYGEWGKDYTVRLFHRANVKWNDAKVHEQLALPAGVKLQKLPGYLLHYTMKDLADYATKMTGYALLSAERYHLEGRKSTWVKRVVSPRFSFLQNFVFKGGFLDGYEGYLIARMTAWYTFLKYARLRELSRTEVD